MQIVILVIMIQFERFSKSKSNLPPSDHGKLYKPKVSSLLEYDMILANLLKQSGSTMTQNLNRYSSRLTLHVYDHCPFCIRVDLFLGWNSIKYDRVIYGYGDVEGPVRMHPHAKKQLPVLHVEPLTTSQPKQNA